MPPKAASGKGFAEAKSGKTGRYHEAPREPASAPAQVFFGLTRGQSSARQCRGRRNNADVGHPTTEARISAISPRRGRAAPGTDATSAAAA